MPGIIFKPVDPEVEQANAAERRPPMTGKDSGEPRRERHRERRRRSRRPPSAWKRFKKGLAEQRRRIAVIVALVVSCGIALAIYMLIRPE